MCSLPPSPETRDACTTLGSILTADIDATKFRSFIHLLNRRFKIYASTCPEPLISPGLIVTTEIRIQSELYLPIADIAAAFYRLYSAALTYPPIFSSTPFNKAASWADAFAELPPFLQFSANPALLLENLVADRELLIRFLFASFLTRRFYGGIGRYPEQQKLILEWLVTEKRGTLRCLDAACGTGEETYGLTLLLSEQGFAPEDIRIKGWTLEPLEVWAAAHRRFPHDTRREARLREATAALFQHGYDRSISFSRKDILAVSSLYHPSSINSGIGNGDSNCYDLILCNG
jgi:hypothetical protein